MVYTCFKNIRLSEHSSFAWRHGVLSHRIIFLLYLNLLLEYESMLVFQSIQGVGRGTQKNHFYSNVTLESLPSSPPFPLLSFVKGKLS